MRHARVFAVAVMAIILFVSASGFCQTVAETCWPGGHLTFQAGYPDDVANRAAAFLIKVENVPAHPVQSKNSSGVRTTLLA